MSSPVTGRLLLACVSACCLWLSFPPQARALPSYEPFLLCVRTERSVPTPAGHFETVVRVERQLHCYLSAWPAGASVPPESVFYGRGRGGTAGSDPADLDCRQIGNVRTAIADTLKKLDEQHLQLNDALADAATAEVEARDAIPALEREAQSAAAECRAKVDAAAVLQDRYYAACGGTRAERRECEQDARLDNADLAQALERERQVCRVSTSAENHVGTARSVFDQASRQRVEIEQRRQDVTRDERRLRARDKLFAVEQDSRCK